MKLGITVQKPCGILAQVDNFNSGTLVDTFFVTTVYTPGYSTLDLDFGDTQFQTPLFAVSVSACIVPK
jgi:hypothetical protein